jgi:hypothetical protein
MHVRPDTLFLDANFARMRAPTRPYPRQLGQHVVLSLPRDSYVVTRSRPYPARQSREVEAVSGWRLGVATSLHLPPWAIQHLKGKTETGINASVICPPPTIRFHHAAPFESCIFLLPTCQLVNLPTSYPFWPTGQLINRSTSCIVSHFCTFARGEAAFAHLHFPSWSTEPPHLRASRVRPLSTCHLASMSPRESACPRVTVPTCPRG